MKTLNQIALLLFCLVFLNLSYAQNGKDQARNPIVIIDPGHGGKDAGATTRNGIKEKDIVLGIASKIVVLNNKLVENPLMLFLTRYTDTLISLGDRTELTKRLKADIFISIHCNQAINRTASGTEVFIHPKSEVQAEESAYLGFTIQKGLTDILGINNRGVKYGNFQVLRDIDDSSAAVLLELGFLSQTDEAIYLTKEDSQNAVALVILQSIIKFLGL
ncbi:MULTISPECIES: N-acetylmuramoyl-L-alanine amidase family protein [Flavobacteriaceae]|jgi:N-acetylmuramoyl-L-alanine amidase|uniref:N-acetylmuramoyl-L-alanine amidase n=1 Tax=Neotamlana laminarinivorans TaxID=2883124 RepID=A0A9X1I379_9FLAO|nr:MULTISPECIES: N-acetylmuramoyl-L-alanine amidase [Flavobacteriaceae]MCB4799382.1 N-acetylmuramoyl-L-alanine amidase [Tamlana laminarinivorans]